MEVTLPENKKVTLSRGIEETMEDLRSKLYEAQATNETFRSQNIEVNRRIIRIARENQEHRQQQLELITNLQDEIQQLKTRVTELPKGKESFPPQRRILCIFCHQICREFS